MDFSIVEEYTSKGLYVIPVEHLGKRPIHNNWTQSTNQWDTVDFQEKNIGLITGKRSNLVVLDIDQRGDLSADEKYQKVIALYPTDLVSRTGSGGYHLFYRYPTGVSRVPNKVGADGIDVRGDGGMVVVPPSVTTKGGYQWVKQGKPGSFPLAFMNTPEKKEKDRVQSKDPDWVMKALQGVSKGGRNDICARLAGYFIAKGLTERVVLTLLQDWNIKNNPPLQTSELRVTVESIKRSDTRNVQETKFHKDIDKPKNKLKFGLVEFNDYMTMFGDNAVKWTVKGWLPESTIAFVVSPPGSYKTWLLMDLAVSVASGMPFLNQIPVEKKGPVIIVQQEDHHPQTVERLAVIASTRLNLVQPSCENDMFKLNMPPDLPIYVHIERQLRFDDPASTAGLAEACEEIKPALVLIDPLYSTVSTDDYMASAASQMMFMKDIRDKYGTTFVLAHHRKKGGDLHREGLWGSQFLNAFLETGWQITPIDNFNVKLKRHFKSAKNPEEIELGFNIDTNAPSYQVELRDSNKSDADDVLIKFFEEGPKTIPEVETFLRSDRSTASRKIKKLIDGGLIHEVDKKGSFKRFAIKHKFSY